MGLATRSGLEGFMLALLAWIHLKRHTWTVRKKQYHLRPQENAAAFERRLEEKPRNIEWVLDGLGVRGASNDFAIWRRTDVDFTWIH